MKTKLGLTAAAIAVAAGLTLLPAVAAHADTVAGVQGSACAPDQDAYITSTLAANSYTTYGWENYGSTLMHSMQWTSGLSHYHLTGFRQIIWAIDSGASFVTYGVGCGD